MLRKSSILLLVSATAFAVEPEHEVYIVNRKPASIAIVNTATWETGASIKLPAKPGQALLAPEGRFAYLLVNGMVDPLKPPKKPAELMIVDLAERKIVKSVPLGPRVSRISLSPDGRFVIALNLGPPVKGAFVSWRAETARDNARKGRVSTGATLTLVDLSSGHSATVLPVGSPASSVQGTPDGSRLFVLATPDGVTLLRELRDDKRISQLRSNPQRAKSILSIYRPGQTAPDRTVELDCWPEQWVITPDGKWAYFLDPGVPSANAGRYQEGELVVVDADAGKVAAVHKAGARPGHLSFDAPTGEITALSWASAKKDETKTQLLRFRGAGALPSFDAEDARFIARVPGVPGRWLVTGTAMCPWPDGASPGTCIPVANKRIEWDDQGHVISSSGTRIPANGEISSGENQKEDQKEPASEASLNGVPDDLLPVRGGEALVVKAGDRLGIVDLKTNRLEHVITTGRGAVKFGKVFGSIVLEVAISAATASSGNVFFYVDLTSRFLYGTYNHEMLVGPEGDAAYALNTFSDDVTVLDANTGKAAAKIPVGGGCLGIGLTPNGRFVVAHSPGQITLIDTRSRRRALEQQFRDDTVNAVYSLRQKPYIVALLSHSLVVIDAESGKVVATPPGKLGDPIQLLEPGQP
jgi:YVTN family beta-propeller protein